jgi:DNA-binding transcriptional MerR regulator
VADFDITELSDRADVTPRTVHFYVQQGLLPPAGSPGPGARYSEGHVARIKLIRLLQKQHLPLAEIARRTKGLTDEQIAALIVETKQRRAEERGSALDYVRSVLAEARTKGHAAQTPAPQATLRRPAMMQIDGGSPPAMAERSQWERYTLADGMELHVRRPLSRVEQRQLDKLMAAARAILTDTEGEDL